MVPVLLRWLGGYGVAQHQNKTEKCTIELLCKANGLAFFGLKVECVSFCTFHSEDLTTIWHRLHGNKWVPWYIHLPENSPVCLFMISDTKPITKTNESVHNMDNVHFLSLFAFTLSCNSSFLFFFDDTRNIQLPSSFECEVQLTRPWTIWVWLQRGYQKEWMNSLEVTTSCFYFLF